MLLLLAKGSEGDCKRPVPLVHLYVESRWAPFASTAGDLRMAFHLGAFEPRAPEVHGGLGDPRSGVEARSHRAVLRVESLAEHPGSWRVREEPLAVNGCLVNS